MDVDALDQSRTGGTGKWIIRICMALAVGLIVLCSGALVLHAACNVSDWWPPMPGVDDRLVGTWTGKHMKVDYVVTLKADGTGVSSKSLVDVENNRQQLATLPFEWGTRDGVFHARYLAIDHIARPEEPYTMLSNGQVVTFARHIGTRIPQRLERVHE